MTVLPAGVSHAATAAVQLTGISVVLENGKTIDAMKVGDNSFTANLVGDVAFGQQTIKKVVVKSPTAKTIAVLPQDDEDYTDELDLQFVNGEAVIDVTKFNNWMNGLFETEGEDYPFTLDLVKTFFVPLASEDYSDTEYKTGYSFTGFLADKDGNESTATLKVTTQDWVKVGNNWKFIDDAGQYLTGWGLIDGKWYLIGADTIMKTGWQYVGGKWYFLNASGAMQTGWQYLGGKWYFLDNNGAMKTGWAFVGGKWYFLDNSGAMKTGWAKVGGKWYFLKGNGEMATGWASVGGKWYYLDNSGAMKTGWVFVGGKWYYLYNSGQMAANTKIGTYRIGADGAWIQ
ncbi:N-acetylmuramoyl-L-alanine amidase family protein [Bacillus sp. S3]|nr:N-acetylmuramoyl-L-alanine amidase family protein [Bacillus sp. S3]